MKNNVLDALCLKEKPFDYEMKVSNALQFVKTEGEELDDATASQLLRDFFDDMETMRRFCRVIEKQVTAESEKFSAKNVKNENVLFEHANATFPLTFGKLFRSEKLVKALYELEEMANILFAHEMRETETEYVNGIAISVPTDCYMQLLTEHNIIEQAEIVEEMLLELFKNTD